MKRGIIVLFLLSLVSSLLYGKDFRILYINSYHPGYPWSDGMESSFRKVINDSGLPVHIFYEYMDTKRLDPVGLDEAFSVWLKTRYRDTRFSVIVAADNNAFDFVKRHRDTLFPGVPVFFCGVNEYEPSLTKGLDGFTGVAENSSFIETLKLIASLQPEVDTVIAVTDKTDMGQSDLPRLRRDLTFIVPSLKLVVLEGVPPDKMKETFDLYNPRKTAIIHCSYFRDAGGHIYEMDEGIQIVLKATKIPVYSKSEVKMGTGILGGVVSSADLQGRVVGGMVLRYLGGTPLEKLAVVPVSPMRTIVDYRVLHDKRIPMSRVPPRTLVLNQPEIGTRRRIVIVAISGLAMLGLLVMILYFVRKSSNLSQTLKSTENNFEQLISELEDGIFYTGRDGTILLANAALAEILGEDSPETIMGHRFTEYVTPLHKDRVFDSFQTALSREETRNTDVCIKRRDGTERWIMIKPILVRKNGMVTGAKGIINDITQRKRAENHLTLQRNLGIGLNQATLPEELFKAAADFLHSFTGIQASALYELTPDSELVLVNSRGIPAPAVQDIKHFKNDSFEMSIVMQRVCCYFNLDSTDITWLREYPHADKIRNLAVIPLISGDRIIGSLNVTAEMPEHFSPETRTLIESAASQITDAFLRIKKESEIRYNRAFLDSIIENLPLGIQIFNAAGNTLRLNKSRAAFLGLPGTDLPPVDFRTKDDPFYQEIYRTGRPVSRELPMVLPQEPLTENTGDRTFFLKEYLFPIRDENNSISTVVSLTQDITRSKHYEGLLEKAREEAELASRVKSEFLANMSHEIRTPLNAIIGYSELLSDLLDTRKEAEFAESILTSGRSLMTILNDILDLSKMEAGMMELHISPVSLADLLRELEQIFALKASEKNLRFRTAVDPVLPESLMLDEIRLRQVLINLIGNAIKFTKTGSVTVTIRAEAAGSDSTVSIVFDIIDTGIGIPEKDQLRIFEAFRQTHRQNLMEYGGTGLGLTISRRLVNFMGGDILIKSEPGKGSIFSVRLNSVPVSSTTDPEKEKENERAWRKMRFDGGRVLIVDDVESNRQIIKESLTKAGIEVREAENGLQAEKLLADWRPDCVLMDLRMPVRDGYETTRIFRADSRWADLFIVALSASTSGKPEDSGLFQRFLLKPVRMNDLFNLLAERIPSREQP